MAWYKGSMATPQTGVFDALTMLAHSPEPPARAALERARRLAHVLQEYSSPAPFVFPTDIGGVQFKWRGGERELDWKFCLRARASRT